MMQDHDGLVKLFSSLIQSATETETEMKTHGRTDLADKERVLIETLKLYPNNISFYLFIYFALILKENANPRFPRFPRKDCDNLNFTT